MIHNFYLIDSKEYNEFLAVTDLLNAYTEEVKNDETEKLKEIKTKLEENPQYVAQGQNLWIIHKHKDDEYLLDLFDKGVKADPILFLTQDCDEEYRRIYMDLGCQQKKEYWREAVSSLPKLVQGTNKIVVGQQGNFRILFTNIDDLNGSVIMEKAEKLKNNEYSGKERIEQYIILILAINNMCVAQIRDNKDLLKATIDTITEEDIVAINKVLSVSKVVPLIKSFLDKENFEEDKLFYPFYEVAE